MMAWALILLSSLLTCVGQLLQKRVALQMSDEGSRWKSIVTSPYLWLAVLSLALGALAWLLVLQRMKVGIAYPMLSLNFVWITLAASWFFGERADIQHWIGIGLIVVGVVSLGWG